jgi:alkylated DNA repair dioxygenase AlkB
VAAIVTRAQSDLFGAETVFPPGFRYNADVISMGDERALLARIVDLPFRNFEFQGFVGKRRVVSYGWKYDFNERVLRKADDIPDFLLSLRAIAGTFADIAPERLQQVLVTEYQAEASIGWHKDKAVFGEVIGLSLLSSCTFRLRRKAGSDWDRVSLTAEPRSAYLLSGPSRSEWEHSIPPVNALRFSITFRNFKDNL